MSVEAAIELARRGRLYPSLILHGRGQPERQAAAVLLARTLLCDAEAAQRPCGVCRHCRRLSWGEAGGEAFHPDFAVLERDLKTSTSAAATRQLLAGAQVSPYEARGQVFVVASAETLSPEAADALLKALEEPHLSAPRHFLLLAPSRGDLPQTLRSRSLAVYLGCEQWLDRQALAPVREQLQDCLGRYVASGSAVYLQALARVLGGVASWEDPRAGRPWAIAAAALVDTCLAGQFPAPLRRGLLALADELLGAVQWRLRGIPAERILEGLSSRHLASVRLARSPGDR